MTVVELIQELRKLPEDHQVFFENGLTRYTRVSVAEIGRIIEPKNGFPGTPRIDLLPSPPEINAVILK